MPASPESITWLGHATTRIDVGGARLLTDPLLRNRFAHVRRQVPLPAAEETDGIDAVLISHLHFDHLDVPSLRGIGTGVRMIVPAGAGELVGRFGFTDVVELGVGDTLQVRDATVTAVPAVHDGRRHPFGVHADPIGFTVAGEHKVYFAGDTDIFDGLHDLAGDLDLALLPIWGWGPSIGAGHMDPRAAAEATAILKPRVVVPIHWATYFPAGLKRVNPAPLQTPGPDYERYAAELAPDVNVQLLSPGQSFALQTH